MRISNPANGEVLREIVPDARREVEQKYLIARRGHESWAEVPLERRLTAVATFRALVEKHTEDLARLLTSEVGKPISQSRNELRGLLGRIDFFLEHSARVLQPECVYDEAGMREEIRHEPLGVVANISAWNYPYFVGSNVFVPALLTGNAVLYKPSEYSTLTGLRISELLHAAGVPEDVFVPVIGDGCTGALLLDQDIDGVFFTGSYGTGKNVAEAAGRKMIRMQLELGGKDPVYVCDDIADIASTAAAVADGAFYNTGQSCCSVERIYVQSPIYDDFVHEFCAAVRHFKIGDPLSDETYIGPLTRRAQIEVLQAQVQDALDGGAKLMAGGKTISGKGNYFEPTVLVNVNHSMAVMREESFGPIIGIQRVADDGEARLMINDTLYGLTAGVYSQSAERAKAILHGANCGSVYWNCCDRVSPRLPWSGRKHSGLGSTLSTSGIAVFTQPKAWHLRGA